MPTDSSSRNLRSFRQQRGLSQVRLSAESGVALTTINVAERGGPLSQRTAALLAPVLGVTVEELIAPPAGPVPLDPRALAAHGLTTGDVAAAEVGTVLQMTDGGLWRVNDAGGLDPVLQGGAPGGRSIASDAAAAPRSA